MKPANSISLKFQPRHNISYKIAYALCEDSDQNGHTRILKTKLCRSSEKVSMFS